MEREAKSAATAVASHECALTQRSQASGRPRLGNLRDRHEAAPQPPAASAERSRASQRALRERALP
jgi:hypothetical protein